MHLNGLVDDLAGTLGNHGLDHTHPDARLLVAENVHGFGGLEDHQSHRLDLASRLRDDLEIATQMSDLLAKRFAGKPACDHHIKRLLSLSDGAHAVMNA